MRYQNECYNKLLGFVEKHTDNWQELLKQKPYSLKAIKQCPWNSNWYMLVYNLFESELINPIVKACRGSVIDISDPKDVKLICAPYLKFCNLGEFPDEDAKIDWPSTKVLEKIDGILIKACKHNGKFHWFTNGSFELNAPLMESSNVYVEKETDDCETFCDLLVYALNKTGNLNIEISEEGSRLLTSGGWNDLFPEGCTLCMELVSPKNKIICDYPESKLFWHGYRNTKMNELQVSLVYDLISKYCEKNHIEFNIDLPQEFSLNEITPQAVKLITDSFDGSEQEGVVVCDKNWHRAKIKSDSYLQLKFSRDVDNISDKNIFHYILTDEIDDMITDGNRYRVDKIKEKVDDFLKQYSFFKSYVEDVYENECEENRAFFAKRCSEECGLSKVRHIAFKIIDGSSAEQFIKRAYGALGNFKKFETDLFNLLYANNLWMTKDVQL